MTKLMSIQSRKEMLASIQEKYQAGDWKVKNQLLDGFVAATDYDRKYAIKLLNGKVKIQTKSKKRGKPPRYDESVVHVLEILWHASNQICSKRIVPFLPELVSALERHGHLHITNDIRERVLSISPATFDRLLRKERIKSNNGLSTTKPGTLLKNQIKIRTFADWDEETPGFFECDLVAHCGETTMGVFLNTLVMTDMITTWTECIAIIKKSADDVILGFDTAAKLLPFSVLGIDVDNGSEFINYELLNYCESNNITFTRSRPYKKNDQAHVEEKNGSIVRRIIGYDRYQSEEAWEIMCELYAVMRLYVNFFQPSLKLINKVRNGSKTVKKYDKAKTPYQRVLSSKHIPVSIKNSLTEQYNKLDPIALKQQLTDLQEKLWAHAWKKDIQLVSEVQSNPDMLPKNEQPKFYRKAKKARREHNWKTRQDPFVNVKDFIDIELQLNPNIHAKEILDKLMDKYPQDFHKGNLRTLQRRVSEIRSKQNIREQKYQDLMVSKKSVTTEAVTFRISEQPELV